MRREWRLFWLCNLVFWLPFFAMMFSSLHDIRWIQAVLGAYRPGRAMGAST